MLVGTRKIDAIILSEGVSTSGKYKFFFAQHWRGKHLCYDVGTYNTMNGEVRRAHTSDKVKALAEWERVKELLTAPALPEEKDDVDPTVVIN